jgi:hypothetical protein
MKTLYEIINVDLAYEFTKERKLDKLEQLHVDAELEGDVANKIEAMDIPDNDDRHHWINYFGHLAGADLLTLGKVQPENMLAMAALGEEDFKEAVKIATGTARNLNELTIEAEKDLNQETVNNTLT